MQYTENILVYIIFNEKIINKLGWHGQFFVYRHLIFNPYSDRFYGDGFYLNNS